MFYAYYFSTDEERFERFHYGAVARFYFSSCSSVTLSCSPKRHNANAEKAIVPFPLFKRRKENFRSFLEFRK